MKAIILKLTAALGLACLLLISMSNWVKSTGIAGFVPGSVLMRNNFYFGKRQWLADTRTVLAAIHYLYRSRSPDPLNTNNLAKNPFLPFTGLDDSTNFPGLEEIGTAILSHERRLSRADSLILRARLLISYNLASADPDASNGVNRVEERLRRDIPQSTNTTVPAMGRFSRALRVSGA